MARLTASSAPSQATPQSSAPAPAAPPVNNRVSEFFRRFPLHSGPITALQYIELIRAHTAAPEDASMSDYVIAGDPTTAITGIATAAIGTLECLNTAAASGKNLIVTLEPIFWADDDNLTRREGNAEFKAKRDFIRDHNMVCFRLHGHWPAQKPYGIEVGMAKELDWESYVVDPASHTSFKVPATTLLDLAKELSTKLNARTLRIVGDPKLPVMNVAAVWGNATQIPTIHLLNGPVDVVLVGYTHEWEAVEYVGDMISTGQKKGMILLGEFRSEQAGMKYCADWLKTFIPDVPIEYIPVSEPYWNLNHPVS
jgi:putative NIF3 family GTP cyclohydrolase 1 type 2